MPRGIDLSFIVQPWWSRVCAAQWQCDLAPHYKPTVVLCGAKLLLDFFTLLFCETVFTACVCVCGVCARACFTFMHLSYTCELGIFLQCRHPERWLVTTLIPWFYPRTRRSPCRDTPLVLATSTPDSPLPSATRTASSEPAASRQNLRCSGRRGATSLLNSQAPSPRCITTTMGITRVRWAQRPTAAISLGCWSPCPGPCPWPDYQPATTTESNRRVWGRDLAARCQDHTQHCCFQITPMAPWPRHRLWKRTRSPASQETRAWRLMRNRASIQVSLPSI